MGYFHHFSKFYWTALLWTTLKAEKVDKGIWSRGHSMYPNLQVRESMVTPCSGMKKGAHGSIFAKPCLLLESLA